MRAIDHVPTALLVIFELNVVVHIGKLARAKYSAGCGEGEGEEKTSTTGDEQERTVRNNARANTQ